MLLDNKKKRKEKKRKEKPDLDIISIASKSIILSQFNFSFLRIGDELIFKSANYKSTTTASQTQNSFTNTIIPLKSMILEKGYMVSFFYCFVLN